MTLQANHNKIISLTLGTAAGGPMASFSKVKDLQIQLECSSLLNRKSTKQDGNKNVVTSELKQGT